MDPLTMHDGSGVVLPGRVSDAGPEIRASRPMDFEEMCFAASDCLAEARRKYDREIRTAELEAARNYIERAIRSLA